MRFKTNPAFLLFVLFVLPCSRLSAQVKAGLTAGVNLARQSGNENQPTNATVGMCFGLQVEKGLKKGMTLQLQVNYLEKGGRYAVAYTDENGGNDLQGNLHLLYRYTEGALQVKYEWSDKKWHPFIKGGVAFGYFANGKIKYKRVPDYIGEIPDDGKTFNADDFNLNRADLSLCAGTGLIRKMPKGEAFLNLEYRHGLTNITRVLDQTLYNRNFLCTIGYLFPL